MCPPNIQKPKVPDSDKNEIKKDCSAIELYIIELLEAIAESQGIQLEEPPP